MKLKVKTIKGSPFEIEADPSDTVGCVKQKVFELKGDTFPVDGQKLIFAGKILANEKTLADYNVSESGFLVCMVSKKRARPTPAPAQPVSAPPSTPVTTPAVPATASDAMDVVTPSTTVAPTSPPSAPVVTTSAPPAEATPSSEGDEKITMLCSMGFPREEVQRALQAAFGNADRAVEYLTTGIPEGVQLPQSSPAVPPVPPTVSTPASSVPATTTATTTATPPSVPSEGDPFEALRHHPQFDALRRAVQSNPQMLPAVMQQISQHSPQLMQAIDQNRDRFVQLLNEPIEGDPAPSGPGTTGPDEGGPGMGGMGLPPPMMVQAMRAMPGPQKGQIATALNITVEQMDAFLAACAELPPDGFMRLLALFTSGLQGMMGGGGGGGGGGAPGGGGGGDRTQIRLNPEESAAIGRLCELGFSRAQALEAYLACDKNEELAANLLFQNMG